MGCVPLRAVCRDLLTKDMSFSGLWPWLCGGTAPREWHTHPDMFFEL